MATEVDERSRVLAIGTTQRFEEGKMSPAEPFSAAHWPLVAGLIIIATGGLLLASQAEATYVAVGFNGVIMRSNDGLAWTQPASPTPNALYAIATDGNQWIAVGDSGTVISSADDGSSWTLNPPIAGSPNLRGLATNGNQWVATSGFNVFVSSNGLFWTSQALPLSGPTLGDVAGFGNVWVAAAGSETAISTDGANTWIVTGNDLRSIATDGTDWAGTVQGFAPHSPDALTWSTTSFGVPSGYAPEFNDIAADGTKWVAIGSDCYAGCPDAECSPWAFAIPPSTGCARRIHYAPSPAGPWTASLVSDAIESKPYAIATDRCGWVVVGWAGLLITSPSALPGTWTVQAPINAQTLKAVAASPCPQPSLACAPGTQTVLVGQPATLNRVNGMGTVTWNAPAAAWGSGTGDTFSTSYGSSGIYTISLADSGDPPWSPAPQTAQCTVVVENPPPLDCTSSLTTTVTGANVSFHASGGAPPYTWHAPASSNPSPATVATLTTSFPTAGDFAVTVSDAGPPVQSATCTLRVNPALSANAGGPYRGLPGERSPIHGFYAGGIGPYTCQWTTSAGGQFLPPHSCATRVRYAGSGEFTVTLTVTDAMGTIAINSSTITLQPRIVLDTDMDGIADSADNCPGVANHDQEWSTEPETGTACDSLSGHEEPAPDPLPAPLSETDWDLDGIQDGSDNCHTVPNPDQADLDGDAQGDYCDADIDGDGVPNREAAINRLDNCPRQFNPYQEDTNANGLGDQCDQAPAIASAVAAHPQGPMSLEVSDLTPSPQSGPWGLVMGGLAAAAAFLGYRLRGYAGLVILFSRLKKADLLDNPTRALLHAQIEAEPGVHFRELVRLSGKGVGTVAHHLAILVKGGIIQESVFQGYKGYRLSNSTHASKLPSSRALRAPLAMQILDALQSTTSASVHDLAAATGKTYQGIMWHLRRLEQAGLIHLESTPGTPARVMLAQDPKQGSAPGGIE